MKSRSQKITKTDTLYTEVYNKFKCGHGRLWYITYTLGKQDDSLLLEAETCAGGNKCIYHIYTEGDYDENISGE